jgi:hypothetical protein
MPLRQVYDNAGKIGGKARTSFGGAENTRLGSEWEGRYSYKTTT